MFRRALKTSIPAMLCYVPLGMVYGVLCTQAGHPWYYAPLFCTCVLAGAMQFLALTLSVVGVALPAIALAIAPLGIRNIFYGLTMLERFKKIHPALRLYLAHGLVDATYSLLTMEEPLEDDKQDVRYVTWLTTLIHAYWVLGGLLGSFVIYFVTIPPGLEFALVTFFAAAGVEQFLKEKDWKGIAVGISSIILALVLFPSHFFIAAIGLAIVTCLALPRKERIAA